MIKKGRGLRGRIKHHDRNPLVFSRTSAVTPEKKTNGLKKPLFLVLLLILFFITFYSPTFKIKELKIIGAEEKKELITNTFNKVKENSFFKGNLLFLNRNNIKEELEKTNEIKDIKIKKDYIKKRLIIESEVLKPVAVWAERGKNFFIDEKGSLYKEIGEGEVGDLKKINNNIINIVSQVHSKPLGERELIFIQQLLKDFENLVSEKIISINFENSFNEMTLFTQNYKIYFDTKRSAASQINNVILIQKEALKNKKKIEYIDLRIESKVFYKFK